MKHKSEDVPTCVAILRSRSSGRGSACGRYARHVDESGQPVCGFHEPQRLRERISNVRKLTPEEITLARWLFARANERANDANDANDDADE